MFDLFFSLCVGQDIPRNHPIYNGLLYSYCPAAAGWWRGGAQVIPNRLPYNVAWKVLADYSSGGVLDKLLEQYQINEIMINNVAAYMNSVRQVRLDHPRRLAPELDRDDLIKADKDMRFGNQNAFDEHFGGDWRNVYEYARIWCWVLMDWAAQIDLGRKEDNLRDFKIVQQDIYIRVPKTPFVVKYAAFVWMTPGQDGTLSQPNIVFLSDHAVHHQFRSALAVLSAPSEEGIWDADPRVFALDPRRGEVSLFEPLENPMDLLQDLIDIGNATRDGPFPPLAAYIDPEKCKDCIFQNYCYSRKGELTENVRRKIDLKKSAARPI